MNEKLRKCKGKKEKDEENVKNNLFKTYTIVKSRKVIKIRVNPDVAWLINNIAKEFVKYRNKMNNISLKNFENVDLNFFHATCAKFSEKVPELVEIPLAEIKLSSEYN